VSGLSITPQNNSPGCAGVSRLLQARQFIWYPDGILAEASPFSRSDLIKSRRGNGALNLYCSRELMARAWELTGPLR
jgi:hypothetical protein